MTEQKKLVEPERVSCVVCFKEIPISEAKSVKATDYIMYYCGLDCYDKWSKQEEKSEKQENDQQKTQQKKPEESYPSLYLVSAVCRLRNFDKWLPEIYIRDTSIHLI